MYTIRHLEDESWAVVDRDGLSVFTGTLRECEEWLDYRENQPRSRNSLLKRLWARLRRLFGRTADRQESNQNRDQDAKP